MTEQLLYLHAFVATTARRLKRALLWRLLDADVHSVALLKSSAANAGDELRVAVSTEYLQRPQ